MSREGMNLAIKTSGNGSEDQIPGWIHAEPGNPVTLGAWLFEQCSRYGVEFQMNTKAVSASLSSDNELLAIGVVRDNETASILKCDKLVLATGPWTPTVFKRLFPDSSVKFEPVVSAGDWFLFENPEPHSSMIAATYFDDIVGEKLEFAGRNDHSIWATGAKSDIGTVPEVGEVPEPDASSLAKLKAYSDAFLKQPQGGLRVIKKGRSYRPANEKQFPIIACIPSWNLFTNRDKDGKTSVYINAGHGSYGVTLGMGSGKIMSQLILGEEPSVNVSSLGV
ncbi:MAG: hypothetical protein Q9226_002185 [Calogaya cf. arnoldii]